MRFSSFWIYWLSLRFHRILNQPVQMHPKLVDVRMKWDLLYWIF